MSQLINTPLVWLRRAMVGLMTIFLFAGNQISIAQQREQLQPMIASIIAGHDTLDQARWLYGKGSEQRIQNVRSLCYYIEQDQAYLSITSFEHEDRVRQIALTTFADVAPGCHNARITGKHLTALHRISLRDSMAKVTAALGPASTIGKLPKPNHEIVYTDYKIGAALLTFQYEHDKLVLVAVDASPE